MRVFWILTDLFLVACVLGLGALMYVGWHVSSFLYDEPPLEFPRLDAGTLSVPLAANALPVDHRVAHADISRVEMTVKEMEGVAARDDFDQLLMMPNQIAGRVLRRAKLSGEPFLAMDLYLEGTEPGAEPPAPHTADPPWPAREKLELLADLFTSARETSESEGPYRSVLQPLAIVDLPAGRVVQESDIGLRSSSLETLRQESLPEFEVLLSPEQFIGRRLLRPKRKGDAYLLSDFAVDGEIERYLERWLPDIARRSDTFVPEAVAPPPVESWPAPLPPEAWSGEPTVGAADDPESLFGPLPDGAQAAPTSRLGQVLADESQVLQFALRSWPILPAQPGVIDFRDVVGNPLAARVYPVSAWPLFTLETAPAWFGGATLRCDTRDHSGSTRSGAISTMPAGPTDGDYVLALPVDDFEPASTSGSDDANAWWRKVEGFGGFGFELPELPGREEFAPFPSGKFDIFP